MNYLETGLPHTQFYPKKTQFSPPRFIPLCNLGRKYMGLETLTRREIEELTRRLSEPKKPASEAEEQQPAASLVRPKTACGTGRFVGQKRMSSLQIEKMVERLYSRRATKDFAFVDDSVDADDIINMTDRTDDSSDSEEVFSEINEVNGIKNAKERKERDNCLIRRRSSTLTRCESDRGYLYKREKMTPPGVRENTKIRPNRISIDNPPPEVPLLRLDQKPRLSVSFAPYTSLLENKVKPKNKPDRNVRRSNTVCSYFDMKPQVKRSQSCPGYEYCKTEIVKIPTKEKTEERSTNDYASYSVPNRSTEAEITRPPPSRPDYAVIKKEAVKPVRTESTRATRTETQDGAETKSPRSNMKHETTISPRQKFPKVDENKPVPRYTATPCDELLIDRVATYNRSPRVRSQ